MADMHEATFIWPEVDAKDVILTGTFDQWSSSIHLTKTPRGFEGKVKLPWGERVLYKFVVDGKWVNAQSQPEEPDGSGNVNNVYECPSKPVPPTTRTPPTDLPPETVKPKHNEIAVASVPASLTAPAAEQQTLPEKANQVAQQVKETVVSTADEVLPGGTGAAFNRAHTAVVVPAAEAVQKVASDPSGTLDQLKTSVPPTISETAQTVSETVKVVVDHAQATVAPAVSPALQAAREVLADKMPEPAKEQAKSTAETVQSKGSGVDPLNPDKIPIATPTPTRDAFIISPQEAPASSVTPASTSQSFPEPETKHPVSSDAETVPAVNAVYPTAPTLVSLEIKPAVPEPPAPEPAAPEPTPEPTEVSTTEDKSTINPAILAPTNPSDAPSEVKADDQPPLSDDAVANETPKEPASTPAPTTEPTAVPEALNVAEVATPAQIPTAIQPSPEIPAPDASPAAQIVQTEAKPVEQPTPPAPEATELEPKATSPEAKPLEQPSPPAPEVTESEPKIATPVPATAPTPAAVDTPPATPAPDVTPEVKPVQAETKPSEPELPATSTVGDIQAADPAPSPALADKVTNGHSPAATPAATPTKKPEASESNTSHAFPTSESKTSASTTSSPAASSKFGSARKKRVSIFGKVKNLFTHDKEDKSERK